MRAGLDWREFVEVDPCYFRPVEVASLMADASNARRVLDWEPTVTFQDLVRIMVDADLQDVKRRLEGGKAALRFSVESEGRNV